MAVRWWTVAAIALAVACGQTRSSGPEDAEGGGAEGEKAGAPASAGGVSGNAGGASSGGSMATQGGGATAGASESPSAGAADAAMAGAAGAENEAPLPLDYTFARWPMPNTLASGLPHPMSYDTSVAGIVKDNVTELEWQRVALEPKLSCGDALAACAGSSLGGHHDWRLPTRIELVSLQAYEGVWLGEADVFPTSGGQEVFWSASSDPNRLEWAVLAFGEYGLPADQLQSVRCVRAPHANPSAQARYTLSSGVVEDNWTGLYWERVPAEVWSSLDEQAARCSALSLGGYQDWRLPSLKELLTLVAEGQDYPALDVTVFPGKDTVVSGWFWSSTLYAAAPGHSPNGPGVRFADGTVLAQGGTSYPLLARCVR